MSVRAHAAYFAGMPSNKPLKYQALIDFALALVWGAIGLRQKLAAIRCGDPRLLYKNRKGITTSNSELKVAYDE